MLVKFDFFIRIYIQRSDANEHTYFFHVSIWSLENILRWKKFQGPVLKKRLSRFENRRSLDQRTDHFYRQTRIIYKKDSTFMKTILQKVRHNLIIFPTQNSFNLNKGVKNFFIKNTFFNFDIWQSFVQYYTIRNIFNLLQYANLYSLLCFV